MLYLSRFHTSPTAKSLGITEPRSHLPTPPTYGACIVAPATSWQSEDPTSDPAQTAKTQKQRKCLHEHWKSCYDYPEAHTWESRAEEDIEEEEAVRALVAAEDDSYLAFDEACRVRQFILAGRLLQDE
ncbi:hypothetical protein EI94DRAFT_1705170 [Lactarius quietus]|nr:hypothetical protein EI94DRAFT_1705170 [Lactarius quietus]